MTLVSRAILCTKIEHNFNLLHALLKKIILLCMVERPNYSYTWVVFLYILQDFFTKLYRESAILLINKHDFAGVFMHVVNFY